MDNCLFFNILGFLPKKTRQIFFKKNILTVMLLRLILKKNNKLRCKFNSQMQLSDGKMG